MFCAVTDGPLFREVGSSGELRLDAFEFLFMLAANPTVRTRLIRTEMMGKWFFIHTSEIMVYD